MRWWIVHRPLPESPIGRESSAHMQITGPLETRESAMDEARKILSVGSLVTGIYDHESKEVIGQAEIAASLGVPGPALSNRSR